VPFLAVLAVLCAAQVAWTAEKNIKPGDKVKVTTGPAPIEVEGKTLAHAKAGTELTVRDVKEDLIEVELRGWVYRSRLKAAAAPASGQGTINRGDRVVVARGPAPIKIGKKTLGTVEAGAALSAHKVKGNWVRVAITGWTHAKQLRRVAKEQPACDTFTCALHGSQVSPRMSQDPTQPIGCGGPVAAGLRHGLGARMSVRIGIRRSARPPRGGCSASKILDRQALGSKMKRLAATA